VPALVSGDGRYEIPATARRLRYAITLTNQSRGPVNPYLLLFSVKAPCYVSPYSIARAKTKRRRKKKDYERSKQRAGAGFGEICSKAR